MENTESNTESKDKSLDSTSTIDFSTLKKNIESNKSKKRIYESLELEMKKLEDIKRTYDTQLKKVSLLAEKINEK